MIYKSVYLNNFDNLYLGDFFNFTFNFNKNISRNYLLR